MKLNYGELGRTAGLTVLVVLLPFIVFVFFLPDQYSPTTVEWIDDDEVPEAHRNKVLRRPKTTAQVVVLGDIGRSPRMQYHALSLAKRGARVDLIGYKESEIHPDIVANQRINIVPISPPPSFLSSGGGLLFLLLGPLKVLFQILSLWRALSYASKASEWMLVQNPPSIPTLFVASLVSYFRNTKLIIDWHNFGYSILALKLSPSHPLVRISEIYESLYAKQAHAHFAVTNAMVRTLQSSFNIRAHPLHDRPAPTFQPLPTSQRSALLSKLPETAPHASAILAGKTRLLVSSTSWTADEDFSILLRALVAYSSLAASRPTLPRILALITGKGPLKEQYLARIAKLDAEKKLASVTIKTAWLSTHDYASLLGSADLGVSLHTSSSGVDLPMKVVDMFGAGLPVVGWSDFEAWSELVKEGFNGQGFESAEELNALLVELFGEGDAKLRTLREGALKECTHRWDDEWGLAAGKVFGLEG